MGGNGSVAWLGELVSVFGWVELDLFSLEQNEEYSRVLGCLWI